MHFALIDRVVEQSPQRLVAIKNVTSAEEYLQDHFPTFPVLPGVMMLEAMVQAGRRLLPAGEVPWVLGQVRALKYARFVRPGETLRVEVARHKDLPDGSVEIKGEVSVLDPAGLAALGAAASGRLVLRPLRPA